jgi:hypothetical protein
MTILFPGSPTPLARANGQNYPLRAKPFSINLRAIALTIIAAVRHELQFSPSHLQKIVLTSDKKLLT